MAEQDPRPSDGEARLDDNPLDGAAVEMTASGGTDKNGDKQAKPDKKPEAQDSDRDDAQARTPAPPSESERSSAAKSNPLRASGRSERDAANDRADASPEDDTDDQAAPNGDGDHAPELRISSSMLQAQPPAGREAESEPPPTTSSATRYRRRVKRLARPVEPAVVNPLALIWPRANSRRNARRASRYGLFGFIVAVVWALIVVPADAINEALDFSSTMLAAAALIGAIAVIVLTAIGYYYHSRLAALASLAGVITLIVLNHQAETVPLLAIAGQAAVVYLLLHGVRGTIAYHIFGRRKRRRGRYNYKPD